MGTSLLEGGRTAGRILQKADERAAARRGAPPLERGLAELGRDSANSRAGGALLLGAAEAERGAAGAARGPPVKETTKIFETIEVVKAMGLLDDEAPEGFKRELKKKFEVDEALEVGSLNEASEEKVEEAVKA